MARTRRVVGGSPAWGLIAALAGGLAGCGSQAPSMTVPPAQHRPRVEGLTFVDETYQCRISVPSSEWRILPVYNDIVHGRTIVQLQRSLYDCQFMIGVSNYHQPNLETFAKVGTFNPTTARFTYVAGTPCHLATKDIVVSNITCATHNYKFTNNGYGYLVAVAFPKKWSQDERLLAEIDSIMNSWEFMAPEAGASSAAPKARLKNVAVLDLVDLGTGKPSETTRSLTGKLQDQCARSGRLELLERRDLGKLVDEHDLQASGMVSGASAVKAGKLLGASHLVSGNLGRIGRTCVVYVQIAETESGRILATASQQRRQGTDEALLDLIPALVNRLLAGL